MCIVINELVINMGFSLEFIAMTGCADVLVTYLTSAAEVTPHPRMSQIAYAPLSTVTITVIDRLHERKCDERTLYN